MDGWNFRFGFVRDAGRVFYGRRRGGRLVSNKEISRGVRNGVVAVARRLSKWGKGKEKKRQILVDSRVATIAEGNGGDYEAIITCKWG